MREKHSPPVATIAISTSAAHLRGELNLEFTAEVLALKLCVLADIGRDHALDLPCLEEGSEAKVVDAGGREIMRSRNNAS